MERYLIDTNVVSDYFSASFPNAGAQFLDTVIDSIPNLSVITQIELLCWNTDSNTEQGIKNFISDSVILGINPDVITHCVALRKNKKVKLPDAIIAATALIHNLTLITRNTKDFMGIDGLQIVNPFEK